MLRPLKRAFEKNVRVGVAEDGSRAGVARVRRLDDGSLDVAVSVVKTTGTEREWADEAAARVSAMGLNRARVSSVLTSKAYQLQPVEMPNVPADEQLAAVRWRIKDLIEYPVDEAVVELVEMPAHANPGNVPIAYAVVTRQDEIMQQIELMRRADLQMDIIDIPELCVRNFAVLLPQDQDGVAFLHFAEECGYLTITRKGVLYLMRRLETGRRALREAAGEEFALQERLSGISLEVQRSLDYYESHYDCRPVTEIIVGPGIDNDTLPSSLADHLGLTVKRITFNDLFTMEDDLSPEEQGDSLLAVGAALRETLPAQQVASS
jgi:MSHA biogenesis protein MshI